MTLTTIHKTNKQNTQTRDNYIFVNIPIDKAICVCR